MKQCIGYNETNKKFVPYNATMTKEEAIIRVLGVLKNPMKIMSPAKQEALDLCEEHNISGKDLLIAWEKIVFKV